MDLSALSNLSKARKQSGHLDQRHEKAFRLYRLGCEYLKRAKKSNYSDKNLTKKSIRCFVKAIENNRNDARPYARLGYLFLLYKDPVQASKYLNEAVRINPKNADAQRLLDYAQNSAVKKIKKKKGLGAPPPKLKLNTQGTPQGQYKALERAIQEQVTLSFQKVQGIKPTLIPINLRQLRDTLKNLEKNYDDLGKSLDVLEQKIDVSRLDMELKKLEINLNLLEDTIKLSEQQIEFKKSMLTLTEQIEIHMERYVQKADPIEVYEDFLDKALDECDELADELEFLEGSGYDIKPLMKYYNKLNAVFQKFDTCLNPA